MKLKTEKKTAFRVVREWTIALIFTLKICFLYFQLKIYFGVDNI